MDADRSNTSFTLTCTGCGAPLRRHSEDRLVCPSDGEEIRLTDGVWRFLSGEELLAARRFLRPYRQLRSDEGWRRSPECGSTTEGHGHAGRPARAGEVERIRAASLEVLLNSVLDPQRSAAASKRLRIVDLGAGHGPVAGRLSQVDEVAAVDLSADAVDGLGCIDSPPGSGSLVRLESSFDRVPLAGHEADVVLYAGSFHYTTDPRRTLREALRLLRPGGVLVVMDSPVYRFSRSGERMLAERSEEWRSRYGGELETPEGIGFVSRRQLRRWGRELGLVWRVRSLPLGWRWHAAPFYALARGRREPARFPVLEARTAARFSAAQSR